MTYVFFVLVNKQSLRRCPGSRDTWDFHKLQFLPKALVWAKNLFSKRPVEGPNNAFRRKCKLQGKNDIDFHTV